MELAGFADPAEALATAARLLQVQPSEILPNLSEALAGRLPHRALAQLSTQCAVSPLTATGEPAVAGSISGADLGPLLGQVAAGRPWQGRVQIGGADLPVLAAASDLTPQGSLLVVVLSEDGPVEPGALRLVQALWDVVTSHMDRLTAESAPSVLAQSRAVAAARAAAVAELSEAHAAALAGLLGVLRSRRVDDAEARSTALGLAVNALLELRADAQRDGAGVWEEEPAGRAFGRLADSLRTLVRHSSVGLELDPPVGEMLLPADTAHAARVAVRAVALAVLEQDGVGRLRVGWRVEGGELRAVVRDDGPGVLHADLGASRIAERLGRLGGRLDVDAVPGWGTTHVVTVPLIRPGAPKTPGAPTGQGAAAGAAGDTAQPDVLAAFGERELEVLERLALGRRNRTIAQELHISESTVKFHVANILAKLGVGSRGEAAAFFHSAVA